MAGANYIVVNELRGVRHIEHVKEAVTQLMCF